jgi:hypothetical protein
MSKRRNSSLMTAARRAAFLDASRAAYNRMMAARRLDEPIEPMTLGNMRANGRATFFAGTKMPTKRFPAGFGKKGREHSDGGQGRGSCTSGGLILGRSDAAFDPRAASFLFGSFSDLHAGQRPRRASR